MGTGVEVVVYCGCASMVCVAVSVAGCVVECACGISCTGRDKVGI